MNSHGIPPWLIVCRTNPHPPLGNLGRNYPICRASVASFCTPGRPHLALQQYIIREGSHDSTDQVVPSPIMNLRMPRQCRPPVLGQGLSPAYQVSKIEIPCGFCSHPSCSSPSAQGPKSSSFTVHQPSGTHNPIPHSAKQL